MLAESLANPLSLLARIIALLVAIGVHEFAHAYTADRLGDPTPREAGRLTLNPFKHLSLWGTVFLFLFRFGWSQPVPVNAFNFRHPRQGMLLTALAGPLSNLLVATICGIAFRLSPLGTYFPMLFQEIAIMNLILLFFNLIPVPPLDGSKILPYILGKRGSLMDVLEQNGFLLLLGLILLDGFTGGRILGTILGLPVLATGRLLLGPQAFLFSF